MSNKLLDETPLDRAARGGSGIDSPAPARPSEPEWFQDLSVDERLVTRHLIAGFKVAEGTSQGDPDRKVPHLPAALAATAARRVLSLVKNSGLDLDEVLSKTTIFPPLPGQKPRLHFALGLRRQIAEMHPGLGLGKELEVTFDYLEDLADLTPGLHGPDGLVACTVGMQLLDGVELSLHVPWSSVGSRTSSVVWRGSPPSCLFGFALDEFMRKFTPIHLAPSAWPRPPAGEKLSLRRAPVVGLASPSFRTVTGAAPVESLIDVIDVDQPSAGEAAEAEELARSLISARAAAGAPPKNGDVAKPTVASAVPPVAAVDKSAQAPSTPAKETPAAPKAQEPPAAKAKSKAKAAAPVKPASTSAAGAAKKPSRRRRPKEIYGIDVSGVPIDIIPARVRGRPAVEQIEAYKKELLAAIADWRKAGGTTPESTPAVAGAGASAEPAGDGAGDGAPRKWSLPPPPAPEKF